MKIMRFLPLAASVAMLGAGCTTDRSYGAAPSIAVTELAELPEPAVARWIETQPLDRLQIDVPQDPNLGGIYLVDSNGMINFPLLGLIEVSGLAPGDIAERLIAGLEGRFLVNPVVRVVPLELDPPTVSIGGEVENPSSYPVRKASTLLRLVNLAGGASEFAQLNDVLIFRTVDGQQFIGAYNLAAIAR
ncbi:MAG: polysaccharide biosynthesis/export family protein, partial [Alteraurantiacibacter sp. bin_em_oilr2.035]|nr:polysaccharide biosynthesis/export family protein [Alteraurantiacibacter sp. bin_em_oilr2.035]